MKTIIFLLSAMIGITGAAMGQNAIKDISITGKYHINKIIPLGKCYIFPEMTNSSKSDYKDITYQVLFLAADGTYEDSTNITFHDFLGPGVTRKIKKEYIDCPKDCKSIVFSIVSGKKLD